MKNNKIILANCKWRLVCFFILILLCPFLCNATDWYASPTGTGTGSFLSPFNLQTALDSPNILPGDNLWLRGGHYNGRFESNLIGSPEAKITVSSYTGEWAILDGNILPSTSTETQVLSVLGGYVRYKDFEITYSDVIRSDATPNYALCGGIEHTSGEDCEFINLIIHDNPGKGVGTWKFSGGTFFYGCIIYNNGYLTPSEDSRGHGPGLYIQNSSDKFRVFKNNIVFNNFHDGFECFSASSTATFQYHKNVTMDDNVVFNNGSPHLVPDPDDGVIKSFGDNNINVSNYSSDGSNVISNINIINNVLYHNTDYLLDNSGETCSLLIGNEYPPCPTPLTDPGFGSENITVKDNFISGRNNYINFKNINTITFQNNFCLGRNIIVDERNKLSMKITPGNWKFSNNTYYSHNSSPNCNPPGIRTVFKMTHIDLDSECKQIKNSLVNTDYHLWNYPQGIYPFCSWFLSWSDTFNIDTDSKWRYFTLNRNPSICANTLPSSGPWNNPPNILSLTQNQYKLNQYKLALLFDPGKKEMSPPDACTSAFQPSNSLVTVNFSNYGITIPNGTSYIIKDVENLSNTTPISGVITGNEIIFDLSTSGFDPPQGSDFINFSAKTPDNFGVFLIEFTNFTECVTDKIVASALPSGCLDFEQASNTITTTSIINSGTVAIYHASNSVVLTDGFHAKSGSRFRGHIEGCTQSFAGRVINPNLKSEVKEIDKLNEDKPIENNLLISPNPNSGIFSIEDIKGLKIKQVIIREINSARIVFEQQYNDESKVDINISNQPLGLYTVNVVYDDNTSVSKTIIKK